MKKIDYLIATEFENKKGNEIIASFPEGFDFSLENIIIEKFLPDGIHNYQQDCFNYQHIVPLDFNNIKELIQRFNKSSLVCDFYINERDDESWNLSNSKININEQTFEMSFGEKDNCYIINLLNEFNIQVVDDNIVQIFVQEEEEEQIQEDKENQNKKIKKYQSFYACFEDKNNFSFFHILMDILYQKSAKKILSFLKEDKETSERVYTKMNFLTIVKNKKEKEAERGAIYKSISICSLFYQNLEGLEKFLQLVIQDYTDISKNDIEKEEYKNKVKERLEIYYDKQNDEIFNCNIQLVDKKIYREIEIDNRPKENTNLKELINMFQEKIMVIYREILFEGKIYIVSRNMSISNLTKIMKSFIEFLRPLNLQDSMFQFETLSGLQLLAFESKFICGFNNPIVFNDEKWTLYVNLDEGKIFQRSGEVQLVNVSLPDKVFIQRIIKLKKISEGKIKSCFYNYTKMQLDLYLFNNQVGNSVKDILDIEMLENINILGTKKLIALFNNQINIIDFKIRKIYGQKNQWNIKRAIFMFVNSPYLPCKTLANLDLLTSLYNVDIICDNDDKILSFLNFIQQINGNINSFLMCIYSNNDYVIFQFMKIYNRIQGFDIVKKQVEQMGFMFQLALQEVQKKLSEQS